MKRVLAFLLALAMVMSLCVTAFAEGGESNENTKGSITISNATQEETYKLYKIFGASVRYVESDDEPSEDDEPSDGDETPEVKSISYSINPGDAYFSYLFSAENYENPYFTYNPNSTVGNVHVKETATPDALIAYLTDMVKTSAVEPIETVVFEGNEKQDPSDPTDDDDLVFENLDPGYYLIISSLNSAVTLTSNTPHVKVIDKNQTPGTDLDKKVETGRDQNDEISWGESNSASIGESFQYKITLGTTNYDQSKKIMYYQIHDEKGDSLWAEFNSIRVYVGGKELPRGYYLSQGGLNTNNWEYLGDVDPETNIWRNYEGTPNRNDAQWYLVHLGYDQFRITIPWLENHTLEDVKDTAGKVVSYKLTFEEDAESIYPSPGSIEITYSVAVEANAAIGTDSHGNRFNKASGSWTSAHETGTTPTDEVVTRVYGIGILKDDSLTQENLEGAKFILYRDMADGTYQNPVAVIPTGIEGVYTVDTNGTHLAGISGDHKQTTRKYYEYLRNNKGEIIKDDAGNEIRNQALATWGDGPKYEMVTPVNGKIVLLGLKAGDYFLVEVYPPEGYNVMSGHQLLNVGDGTRPFSVYADNNGKVADIQTEDGTHNEFRYDLTQAVVHNSKGAELPATGGEGRMMLICFGSVIAMGFAVLMITQKKMSVYRD